MLSVRSVAVPGTQLARLARLTDIKIPPVPTPSTSSTTRQQAVMAVLELGSTQPATSVTMIISGRVAGIRKD